MKRTLLSMVVLSLAASPSVQGQEAVPVRVGDKVRVVSADCGLPGTHSWKVRALDQGAVTMVQGNTVESCPYGQITRMEVFDPTSPLKTAGFGLLIGAASGALILGLPTEPCGGDCGCDCRDFAMFVGGVLGAGTGLLVGTALGLTRKLGRWDEAGIPVSPLSAGVSPDGRFNLGITLPVKR